MFGIVSAAEAQSEVVLHSFAGGTDGANPQCGLVSDREGNLYGTTTLGTGGGSTCENGCGTVFKLDPRGNETILHVFSGFPDGTNSSARLTLDSEGNLYGTTEKGGAYGYGTVFKVDKKNNETVLHSFSGVPDGSYPYNVGGLTLDREGNLYGTTLAGGNGCPDYVYGCGTVFKLDPSGNETILYNFKGLATPADGYNPLGGVVLGRDGNLYGTTLAGGAGGAGTVFKLDPSGDETILHTFLGPDGVYPQAGVILDREGNLYGTTVMGGIGNLGVVFKLDPSGDETVLHRFSGPPDGLNPRAGLVFDHEGNLYGTTIGGGTPSAVCPYVPADEDASGCGTVFKVSPKGDETVVYSFHNSPDGAFPEAAGVILDWEGNIYGTTAGGGTSGYGTVFKIRRRFNARDPQVFPLIQ
jgi:uncharacterized repeat protein (TIGR03803 family)